MREQVKLKTTQRTKKHTDIFNGNIENESRFYTQNYKNKDQLQNAFLPLNLSVNRIDLKSMK